MNGKISLFVTCVDAIIYLLYNLHDCTMDCFLVGPFHAIGIFLYPMKTEDVWSSDFLGGILSDN